RGGAGARRLRRPLRSSSRSRQRDRRAARAYPRRRARTPRSARAVTRSESAPDRAQRFRLPEARDASDEQGLDLVRRLPCLPAELRQTLRGNAVLRAPDAHDGERAAALVEDRRGHAVQRLLELTDADAVTVAPHRLELLLE